MIFKPVIENTVDKNTIKARRFMQEVEKLSKKYNLPVFAVTDGASLTIYTKEHPNHPAVKNARSAHMVWEKQNDIDPDHDWTEDIYS